MKEITGRMSFIANAVAVVVIAILITKIPGWLKPRKQVPFPAGYVKPGWERVERAFRLNFADGMDKGSAFAVYHKGELVFSMWGGFANEDIDLPWKEDTVTKLYSAAKGLGAAVIAILVDRGKIKYEDKVCDYWPEFKANGKESITVEQLLSHQAGLYVLDEPYSEMDTLNDWPKIKRIMEQQTPHWKPGSGHGYHGVNIGLFMDQLVRQVDKQHRSIAQYFREEISQIYDIDYSFGIRREDQHRHAWFRQEFPSVSSLFRSHFMKMMFAMLFLKDSHIGKMVTRPTDVEKVNLANNPDVGLIENPSHAGYGTASGIAKFFGILANGGEFKGRRLIAAEGVEKLKDVMASGQDKVFMFDVTYGRGTTLWPTPTGGLMFGTPGSGGQMAYGDTDNKLGWAFITNYCNPTALNDDPRYKRLETAMYETVQQL